MISTDQGFGTEAGEVLFVVSWHSSVKHNAWCHCTVGIPKSYIMGHQKFTLQLCHITQSVLIDIRGGASISADCISMGLAQRGSPSLGPTWASLGSTWASQRQLELCCLKTVEVACVCPLPLRTSEWLFWQKKCYFLFHWKWSFYAIWNVSRKKMAFFPLVEFFHLQTPPFAVVYCVHHLLLWHYVILLNWPLS